MSKVVLQCKKLSKVMNKKNIVSNVTFDLCEKDILGFIGPNGAGKTSIIKLILGLYKKDEGSVVIKGFDLDADFVKAISEVGAIIENPALYMYMTGYDNLMITAKIYNISNDRVNQVIKLLNLEKFIMNKVSKYSLGMKQRLGIAQAIIHNPKILILDEPTNGLDPNGIMDLNKLLKKLSSQGMSIIISSHILSELENLCNKFCFVKDGKIIAYKSLEELNTINDKLNYIFEISDINLTNILCNYEIIDNNHIRIKTTKNKLNKIIKTIINNKIKIYEIRKEKKSLEKVFFNVMDGSNNA